MPRSRRPTKPPRASPAKSPADPLIRIADALDRALPGPAGPMAALGADGYVWQPGSQSLSPVSKINYLPLELLRGIDRQAEVLLANSSRHADGFPANNALLWGARGTGKSSVVKAVHASVNDGRSGARRLVLIEIHREDVETLPKLLAVLRESARRFVLFCDDLTFEGQDASYKALKSVLEGGIEGRPENVVLYATSNRRHMMAREMIDNERAAAIHDTEAIEEKVSLSDRFGLWLGFHHIDQATYLEIVAGYAKAFKLPVAQNALHARAVEWAATRGARSGRVAWQFIQDLAGELGKPIKT